LLGSPPGGDRRKPPKRLFTGTPTIPARVRRTNRHNSGVRLSYPAMKQFGFERPLVFSLWKHSLLWNEQTHENLVLLVNVVVGPLLRPTLRTKNRRLVETRMNGGNKHAQTNDWLFPPRASGVCYVCRYRPTHVIHNRLETKLFHRHSRELSISGQRRWKMQAVHREGSLRSSRRRRTDIHHACAICLHAPDTATRIWSPLIRNIVIF